MKCRCLEKSIWKRFYKTSILKNKIWFSNKITIRAYENLDIGSKNVHVANFWYYDKLVFLKDQEVLRSLNSLLDDVS